MDMLYMPMMDLQQHLNQELLVNPFLELIEPEEEEDQGKKETNSEQEKEKQDKEQEIDWEEILLNGFDAGGMRPQYEEQEYLEPVCVETPDLIDHLREQLHLIHLTPRQQLLSEEFLGSINEEGYLTASLEEIGGSVNALLETHVADQAESESEDSEEAEAAKVEVSANPGSAEAPAAARNGAPEVAYYTPQELEEMLRTMQRLDPPGVGARD